VRQIRGVILWGLPWVPAVLLVHRAAQLRHRHGRLDDRDRSARSAGLPLSFLFNYIFMYGNWGAPEMGAAPSA
jgi:hypothetical protein